MTLKVDTKTDALYFRLNNAEIIESEEIKPGIIIDYDKHSNIVGVEILKLSNHVDETFLKKLEFETV